MREVYERELGVVLPVVTVADYDLRTLLGEFETTPIRSLFTRHESPEHLDVAEMANRRTGFHVGVYVLTPDGPRILHNIQGSGTVCEPLNTIEQRVTYWRYG